MNRSKRGAFPLAEYMKTLRTDKVKKGLSSLMGTIEVWKADNVGWRQVVGLFHGREIWIRLLKNFRELEGSWPRAVIRLTKIFQGKPARRHDSA